MRPVCTAAYLEGSLLPARHSPSLPLPHVAQAVYENYTPARLREGIVHPDPVRARSPSQRRRSPDGRISSLSAGLLGAVSYLFTLRGLDFSDSSTCFVYGQILIWIPMKI